MITLAECIAEVESAGNQNALRFEPVVWRHLDNHPFVNGEFFEAAGGWIDSDTSAMIAATSFGLYQILGVNIWNGSYKGTMCEYLSDLSVQAACLRDFFIHNLPNYDPFGDASKLTMADLQTIGRIYNGNAVLYGKALADAYHTLASRS